MKHVALRCAPIAVGLLFLALASCSPRDRARLQREDLFFLEIGPLEDQIALFAFHDDVGMPRAGLAMRDGFFFLSDGAGRRVVRYSSFGDLLFLVFNDDASPGPSELRIRTEEDGRMTRWAYPFPFRSPGRIAVDSRRHIFVEEILPDERHVLDEANQVLLDSVILHFDEDGLYVDFIGQRGRGGPPFPRVAGLHVSADDEIVVVSRLAAGWDVFWHNSDGEQLFMIHLRHDAVPPPPGMEGFSAEIDAVIDAVIPAPDARRLFVKVDYYRAVLEPMTGNRAGTETLNSVVWILRVEGDEIRFEDYVRVPFFELREVERGQETRVDMLFSMLGVVNGGGMLFHFPVDEGYAVLRLDSEGGGQRRGVVEIEPDRHVFNAFHLSPDGILSALLADEWTAAVSWWRMEEFMTGAGP